MGRCGKCAKQNTDDALFCSSCGSPLTSPERPSREQRKIVSVVFCDMAGSTSMGERLDPESLRQIMLRYYAELRFALERHGGTVEKFIGDAVMAVFGIPAVHEDDALRAVRAAMGMREALERLNRELEQRWAVRLHTRIGVNTGKVVAGDPSRGEGFVVGDAVNTAARLEQVAPTDEVLISDDTYRLVQDDVEVEAVQPLELKGKSEPVPAYRLVAVSKIGMTRRLDSPIVGRDPELAHLDRIFEETASELDCRMMSIIGPAGVGKSRLTLEFLSALSGRARFVRGRCLPYGEGITFWPIAEIVKEATGIADDDSPEEARQKVAGALAEELEHDAVVLPVAAAIGLSDAKYRSEETFLAIRRLLEAAAGQEPFVVVFDDVHWGEQTFLDLVEYLSETLRGHPVMLLCIGRVELREVRPSLTRPRERRDLIVLEPLREDQSNQLVTNLLGRGEPPRELAERVMATARGNPLFVEEMLRMLVDQGLLRGQEDHWCVEGDLAQIGVPLTIEALLSARLEGLSDGERAVIECASVMGEEFWVEAVMELSPQLERRAVFRHLGALVEKELVAPGGQAFAGARAYRFGHILIRDVAYGGLLKETRATLHQRFADWIEQRARERIREYGEIIGYHLEQAHRCLEELGPLAQRGRELGRRAGLHLGGAGNRALARGDMPAAVKLLGRAQSLLPPESPIRAELLLNEGTALFVVGELGRAEQALAGAASAAAAIGDRGLRLHAMMERAALRADISFEGYPEELRSIVEEAIPAFEELGYELGLARAYQRLANVHADVCKFANACEYLERALVHVQRAGDDQLRSRVLGFLGLAVFLGPVPVEEGITRLKRLIEPDPSRGRPIEPLSRIALAEVEAPGLAGLEAMRGRFDEARALCAHAKDTLKGLGQRMRLVELAESAGWIEMLAGDATAAECHLRFSYQALEEMGEEGFLPVVAGQLSKALYLQGCYREAEQVANKCEELAASWDVVAQVLWRTTRAKVWARRQEFEVAEAVCTEAIELAGETDMLNLQADVFMAQAEILLVADRVSDAAVSAKHALELYEAKGNIVSAGKAETLFQELKATAGAPRALS